MEILARGGFATRGIVYLIIGGFAALAPFGPSDVKGTKGALATILSQPFGQVLLWLAILGLLGFALWRFVQAYLDVDRRGSDPKGIAVRAAMAGSGLIHVALAAGAASLVLGWGGSGNGDPSGRWIAAAYEAGYGQWLTWLVALLVAAVAGAQIWKGYKVAFESFFTGCPPGVMKWLRPLGRIGFIARGVTFLIIAGLVFYGGLNYRGSEGGPTPGLADALKTVQDLTFGWVALFVIALGLIAFGLYSLAAARYRRVGV